MRNRLCDSAIRVRINEFPSQDVSNIIITDETLQDNFSVIPKAHKMTTNQVIATCDIPSPKEETAGVKPYTITHL